MAAKILMVTGISGSGSKEFARRYSEESGQRVKVYNTGEMMRVIADDALNREVPAENFLNLAPDTLDIARYSTFQKITNNLEKDAKEYDRIVVDTHMWFFWNRLWQKAFNWDLLNKIPADMYVSIIDKPSNIRARQMKTPMGQAQRHNLSDLLSWMQMEVDTTGAVAELYRKPHYVFSSKQSPGSIESLYDNSLLIYASFPMTDANPETTKRINDFKTELRNLRRKVLNDPNALEIPLIDPAEIDIETGKGLSKRDDDAIKRHTVYRDLIWDVGRATHTISFYPNAETDLSAGVTDEYIHAYRTGKDSYVICPRKRRSPFLDKNSVKFFETKDQFMKFFEKKIVEDLQRFKRK